MAEDRPPRHFAVQRALPRGWRTLHLSPRQDAAAARFRQDVQARPRAILRLIEVDYRKDPAAGEFDWRLVELHDPRRLGLVPDLSEGPGPPSPGLPARPAARAPERVRVPVALYALFLGLGAALAVLAWLAGWGPGPLRR